MSQETEVTKVDPKAVASYNSDRSVGRGHEDSMTQDDFEIPRAKIVQFSSEEAKSENKDDRIDPGTFINSVSKSEIVPVFIPIFRYKTYTKWNAKKKSDANYDPAYELGELIFSTTDRHDPRIGNGLEFINGEKPQVTQTLNFLCYFEGQRIPLVLSFQSTSYKAGKRLNTLLEEAGGDMFSNKFKITSKIEGDPDKYYVLDVRANGKASPEEFAICEQFYNRFRGQSIDQKVHKETEQFTE